MFFAPFKLRSPYLNGAILLRHVSSVKCPDRCICANAVGDRAKCRDHSYTISNSMVSVKVECLKVTINPTALPGMARICRSFYGTSF